MLQAVGTTATHGGGACYLRRRGLLPTAVGGATYSGRCCSQAWEEVLQAVGSAATYGGGCCYQRRRVLLPTVVELLSGVEGAAASVGIARKAAGAATNIGGRCYERRRVLLRGVGGGQRCYERRRALLPGEGGGAANRS